MLRSLPLPDSQHVWISHITAAGPTACFTACCASFVLACCQGMQLCARYADLPYRPPLLLLLLLLLEVTCWLLPS